MQKFLKPYTLQIKPTIKINVKRNKLVVLIALLFLFSCTKEEGEGGHSSITGKVFMTDQSGVNQGEYYAPDYDVFIIYGDNDNIYDDDTKTNFDGSFQFKNLRKGTYRVFAYTTDASETSGVSPVFKTIEIGKKEDASIGTISVTK